MTDRVEVRRGACGRVKRKLTFFGAIEPLEIFPLLLVHAALHWRVLRKLPLKLIRCPFGSCQRGPEQTRQVTSHTYAHTHTLTDTHTHTHTHTHIRTHFTHTHPWQNVDRHTHTHTQTTPLCLQTEVQRPPRLLKEH